MISHQIDALRSILNLDGDTIELHPIAKQSVTGNSYFRATYRKEYFLKTASSTSAKADTVIAALADLGPPCFKVPRLFGRVNDVEVWEYVEGHSKSLSTYSRSELASLIDSLVATEVAISDPDLDTSFWMRPVAARLRSVNIPKFHRLDSHIRHIAYWERAIIERSLGPCLTHNDLHSNNILFTNRGFCVVDWGSASLGAPGASLRVFAEMAKCDEVVNLYAATRKRYGKPVDPRDVRFTMIAHQAMWALHTGYRQRIPDRIKRGYALMETLSKENSQ